MGTECQCQTANGKHKFRYASVLEWRTWSWYLCPLELWLLGTSRPAVGFTLTRPFMSLYILQTLSDVLLDSGFLDGAGPPGQRHFR